MHRNLDIFKLRIGCLAFCRSAAETPCLPKRADPPADFFSASAKKTEFEKPSNTASNRLPPRSSGYFPPGISSSISGALSSFARARITSIGPASGTQTTAGTSAFRIPALSAAMSSQRIAQLRHVIKSDGGDRRHDRLITDIGGISFSSQSHFQDDEIRFSSAK